MTVPDIRRITDRLWETINIYTRTEGASSELMLAAQNRYEKAINWISQVEERSVKEQLHLDAKQPDREVDFQPFSSGSSVSIYEFFSKLEAWSRGVLTLDSKAHVLYTRFLDASIVVGNKELEMRKESYAQMKSWLCDKYGRPAHVADLHLENIRRLARPADGADPLVEAAYLKAVYSNLVTLTGLEKERGVKIQKLEDHIHSNDFLSRLGDALPTGVRNQFIDDLEDTDYSRIEGKQHLQRIISLLKKAYTKAEATASAAGGLLSAAYHIHSPNTDRTDTAAQSTKRGMSSL